MKRRLQRRDPRLARAKGSRYVKPCPACGRNMFMVQNMKTGEWLAVEIAAQLDGPGRIVMRGDYVIKAQVLTDEELAGGHFYRHRPHQAVCAASIPSVRTDR